MIEKILTKLNAIPSDKVYHFAGGTILFAAALPFIGYKYAMAFVVIVGFAKELYDAINKDRHTPDIWDAIATILGGMVGLSCAFTASL